MPLNFSLVPVPGTKDKYRAIAQTGKRVSYETFQASLKGRSSVSPSDVTNFVELAADWIVSQAIQGKACDLGDLGRSKLGVSGTFDTPTPDRITHDDVEITLSWVLSGEIQKRLRQRVKEMKLQQVQPRELSPIVSSVSAPMPNSKRVHNAWYAGAILNLKGLNLKFDPDQPDEGVFLTPPDRRSPVRAWPYQRATLKNVVCQVPSELAGEGMLQLEVRRRSRQGTDVLVGEYDHPLIEVPIG